MKQMTTQQKSRWIIGVALLALIGFGLLKTSAINANADAKASPQAITVTALMAKESAIARKMMFSGPVVGRDEVPVFSDLTQGRIDKILVDAGQRVKAGTVLATIDGAYLRIQKAQQQAGKARAAAAIKQQETSLEEAKAQYEQAQAERKRAEAVAKTGLISKEALEQKITAEQLAKTHVQAAKSALSMAHADFSVANAQVAESELHLTQAVIRSPVSGLVVERKARTGMSLAQNSEPLFNILRDDDVEVELEVSADDATRLKLGMPASLQLVGDAASAAAPSAGNVDEVLTRVEAWATAWQNKDVDAYLNSYSAHFVPEQKMTHTDWLEQRKKRLSAQSAISITLSKINVKVNGDKATEEFVQYYVANGKAEDSNKRLTLVREGSNWAIVREQIVPQLDSLQAERVASDAGTNTQETNIYNGRVSRAATEINRQNQIAKVRVRFNQTPHVILGQFARVSILTVSHKGIYLPDTAVRFEGSAAYIFTVKNGKAQRVAVRVGQHIGNNVEMIEGVPAGMLVIDSAASFLRDGEAVRLAPSAGAK